MFGFFCRQPPSVDRRARLSPLVERACESAKTYFRYALSFGLIAGLVAATCLNLPRGCHCFLLASAGFAVLCGGVAFFGGALAGFLFAIPRTLSGSARPTEPALPIQPAKRSDEYGANTRYGANTNLEQISDWLTKIIVGVGLVEFRQIINGLERMGRFLGPLLGESPSGDLLAIVIVLYFGLVGFLIMYLITRMYFGPALTQSDDNLAGDRRAESLARSNRVKLRGNEEVKELDATATQKKAMRKVSKLSFDSLHTAEQLSGWAKAKVNSGKPKLARDAYKRALQLEPGNARLIVDYVDVLGDYLDKHQEALDVARRGLNLPTLSKDQRLRLKRDEIFNLLWINLDDAISYGEQYLKDGNDHPRVRAHLIYAYAGKYGTAIAKPENQKVVKRIKELLEGIPPDSNWREVMRKDVTSDTLLRSLKGQEWFASQLGT